MKICINKTRKKFLLTAWEASSGVHPSGLKCQRDSKICTWLICYAVLSLLWQNPVAFLFLMWLKFSSLSTTFQWAAFIFSTSWQNTYLSMKESVGFGNASSPMRVNQRMFLFWFCRNVARVLNFEKLYFLEVYLSFFTADNREKCRSWTDAAVLSAKETYPFLDYFSFQSLSWKPFSSRILISDN